MITKQVLHDLNFALMTIQKYNSMSLKEFVEEVETMGGFIVNHDSVENFKHTGLSNIDFYRMGMICEFDEEEIR